MIRTGQFSGQPVPPSVITQSPGEQLPQDLHEIFGFQAQLDFDLVGLAIANHRDDGSAGMIGNYARRHGQDMGQFREPEAAAAGQTRPQRTVMIGDQGQRVHVAGGRIGLPADAGDRSLVRLLSSEVT